LERKYPSALNVVGVFALSGSNSPGFFGQGASLSQMSPNGLLLDSQEKIFSTEDRSKVV